MSSIQWWLLFLTILAQTIIMNVWTVDKVCGERIGPNINIMDDQTWLSVSHGQSVSHSHVRLYFLLTIWICFLQKKPVYQFRSILLFSAPCKHWYNLQATSLHFRKATTPFNILVLLLPPPLYLEVRRQRPRVRLRLLFSTLKQVSRGTYWVSWVTQDFLVHFHSSFSCLGIVIKPTQTAYSRALLPTHL